MIHFKKHNKLTIKVVLSIFLMTTFMATSSVKAYDSSTYYNNQIVTIGLESMLSNVINVTINGDYMVNSKLYPSGTSFQITNNNLKFALNGVEIDSIGFISQKIGNTLCITSRQNKVNYLGDMSFKIKTLNGIAGILPINNVNIEDYLKGVVPAEMYSTYDIEALKAQAIAARTYVLKYINKHNGNEYDLCDTTHCQAYKSYDIKLVNVNKAVDDTRSQVLLSAGSLLDSVYSASNGGYTEVAENVWSGNIPGLVSQPDSFDLDYVWTKSFTLEEIEKSLKDKGYILSSDKFKSINLSCITTYISGRVNNIEIDYEDAIGAQKNLTFSKEKARTFLSVPAINKNLPSSMYTVTFDGRTNTYIFSGKGYGHGIGMSQVGAQKRALSGQTYKEILNFYYGNPTITESILNSNPTPNPIPTTTPTIAAFTLDKTTAAIGSNVILNATCKGGAGFGYQYKYVIKKAGTLVLERDYSNNSTLEYPVSAVGDYNVYLYIKDASSTNIYDDTKNLTFSALNVMDKPGWNLKEGKWYFMQDGKAQTGWQLIATKWYYMNTSGEMQTGWIETSGKSYYIGANGDMKTGWVLCDSRSHTLNQIGSMETNSKSNWYYMGANGEMKTDWVLYNGKWYYLYSFGAMASNTTINGYRLNASGAWIK